MNKEIIAAVERLFSACLEVTAAGKYHAFCEHAGHVNRVDVRLYPANANYSRQPYTEPMLNESVKLVPFPTEDANEHAEFALNELNSLTDRLYGLAAQEQAA